MRKALAALALTGALALVPTFGAVASQTDWLEPTEEIAPLEWTKRMTDTPSCTEAIHGDPIRTQAEEVKTEWWEVTGEYINDTSIPDDIEEAALIYGSMFNICPELLMAICDRETGGTYRTDLIDSTGTCYGPMQIHTKAQKDRISDYGLSAEDLFTADGAMLIAASYLAELFEASEDPAIVLYKYNGNTTGLKNYKKTGQITGYAKYVLDLSEKMERKHGK